MAGGKGGGAWKVAYADFVTAMMAFFMVMWLCSQDQKVKDAVARYFNSPVAFEGIGFSKRPFRTGDAFDAPRGGPVPDSPIINGGSGRNSNSKPGEPSPETQSATKFIHQDREALEHWKKRTRYHLMLAKSSDDVRNKKQTHVQAAARPLSRELLDDFKKKMPDGNALYFQLLNNALHQVNWYEVAEDLIEQAVDEDNALKQKK